MKHFKSIISLLIVLALAFSLAACGTSGSQAAAPEAGSAPAQSQSAAQPEEGKQIAERTYTWNGQDIIVTVDLSDGWSTSFASGAVYLYDGFYSEDREAIAHGYFLDPEEYEQNVAEYSSYDSFTQAEDGSVKFSEEAGGSNKYIFPVSEKVYFMIAANQSADAESIYQRFSVQLDPYTETESAAAALSLWTDTAPLKQELTAYMEAITDENSADFIPVENRIAVFDLDGTLFCETDPNYFDYTLLVHRVLEDEDYKDKASDFEKETAEKIVTLNETGVAAEGLEVDHGKAVASAFAGMTLDEFNAYIQDFKQLPMPSYEGMKRGEGWYQPMLQVVEYLQANDFTVYVVSGTDRFIVRGIVCDSPLHIPMGQIIGSDETLVAPDQEDTDGLQYVYDDNDKLVLGGDFVVKNLKMNKVTVIAQEIGVQPVLSFGNSSGDASMAEYATSNNPYKSLAFMLCCDDTERENGNVEKAEKMAASCEEFGWVPVSMKNDWTTIYGDGVTKK